jgi:hypothetical protein
VWSKWIPNGFRTGSSNMSLELLKEQLQENLLTHLDFCKTLINLDHVCQVVVDTFKEFEV